ncbi:MAG: hypothetical protein JO265_04680, partial [Acidimicrobiia bacterium]|nr:hypothetical protein [Acidimicrobiia bacterium]
AIHGSILSNPTMGAFDSFGTSYVGGAVQLNGLSTTPGAVIPRNGDVASFVDAMTISGPLSVTNAQAGAGGVDLVSNTLSGPVVFANNNLPTRGSLIEFNTAYSSIRVTNNTGPADIFSNTVYGGVACGGNAPAWTATTNTVYGTNGAAGGTC